MNHPVLQLAENGSLRQDGEAITIDVFVKRLTAIPPSSKTSETGNMKSNQIIIQPDASARCVDLHQVALTLAENGYTIDVAMPADAGNLRSDRKDQP